jgi:hypothetical protein
MSHWETLWYSITEPPIGGLDTQVPSSRILVAFSFGRNNGFSGNFERGTKARHRDHAAAL